MREASRAIASVTARATARCIATLAFALCIAAPAVAQTCTFNAAQPNTTSFGVIDPSLATTMTFSVTLNYKCTGSATASFTITGANDTGPGAYRLQNQTQATQYMAYSITTVDVPGTKITLNGQLLAANYQNAYVGNYVDTLNVVVLP
jgi:hypothetical protein